MPKNESERLEFEERKDIIVALYESKPLKEVMELMAQQNFVKSKGQYTRAFERWGVSKNIKQHEYKYIFSRAQKRRALNQATDIEAHGYLVKKSKLEKQKTRIEYQTTFDRIYTELHPDGAPPTPPGIRLLTPPLSTSPNGGSPTISVQCDFPLFFAGVKQKSSPVEILPWCQFLKVFSNQYMPWSNKIGCSIDSLISYNTAKPTTSDPFLASRISQPRPHSSSQSPVDGAHCSSLYMAHDEKIYSKFLEQRQTQRWFSTTTPHTHLSDPRGGNSYLEVLKLIVNMIANNFASFEIDQMLLKLMERTEIQRILGRLICQNLISIMACTGHLLEIAVRDRNHALVKVLITSGVDVNLRIPENGGTCTALQIAIDLRCGDIVDMLLEHGASDWRIQKRYGGYTPTDYSIIDDAVQSRDFDLTEKLLYHESHNLAQQYTSLRTFRFAVLGDELEILQLLALRRPETWERAKLQPWLLLEAAASVSRKDTSILSFLWQAGFDVHSTNERGIGSPFVAASSAGNTELVKLLLDAGLSVNGTGIGLGSKHCHLKADTEVELGGLEGMSALHMAIEKDNGHLVKLLLARGADPNQWCQLYPIQRAATIGSRSIVGALIEYGANVDARHNGDISNIRLDYYNRAFPEGSAIEIALQRGSMSIFRDLWNNGARLPASDPPRSSEVSMAFMLACAIIRDDNLYLTPLDDIWDPWTVALANLSDKDIQIVVSAGYVEAPLTSTHLSQCIIAHGINFTERIFGCGFFSLKGVLHPIVLHSLIFIREEDFSKHLIAKIVAEKGREAFIHNYGVRALVLAISRDCPVLVQILLEAGVDPFMQDLHSHVGYLGGVDQWEHIRFVSYVLEYLDYRYKLQESSWPYKAFPTAFIAAFRTLNVPILQIFLGWKGGYPNTTSVRNREFQLCAAYLNAICLGYSELEKMLENLGFNLENTFAKLEARYRAQQLRVSLPRAIDDNDLELAQRLLDLGADPHAPAVTIGYYKTYHTALQTAAQNNNPDLAGTLLAMGADVNAQPADRNGATSIQFAAINGNFEIFNLLLDAGGDIHAPPGKHEGRTAIEGAAEHGRLDMVSHLLNLGVDIKERTNTNYRRTIYRACIGGHYVLANMIQDWKRRCYGADDCEEIETIKTFLTKRELGDSDDDESDYNETDDESDYNETDDESDYNETDDEQSDNEESENDDSDGHEPDYNLFVDFNEASCEIPPSAND